MRPPAAGRMPYRRRVDEQSGPTVQEPVAREAARAVLVDTDDRVLLLQAHVPHAPEVTRWWFTPGGGLKPGEDAPTALCREVLEETGLDLSPADLGPVRHEQTVEFPFEGRRYRQHEVFHLVRVQPFEVDVTRWTAVEQRDLVGHRWWPLEELAGTDQTVYPGLLAALVSSTIRSGWL